MIKYKFFLDKTVSWYPRFRQRHKTVIIEADNLAAARSIIYETYKGWEVSMFWYA